MIYLRNKTRVMLAASMLEKLWLMVIHFSSMIDMG